MCVRGKETGGRREEKERLGKEREGRGSLTSVCDLNRPQRDFDVQCLCAYIYILSVKTVSKWSTNNFENLK